jgi:PBSX family phage terminase large subunit
MAIIVRAQPAFKVLYNLPKDTNTVCCIGGRGGMKTYEVSKWAAFSSTVEKKRIVVLRDEKSLIKESILNEIWERYESANSSGALDPHYIKNETELKDRKTGKTLIYTKGFRASTNTKSANLKGPSDIDIAIIEETEDIRDPQKFNTFVDGLRKEGCVIVFMLNTPDIQHFLIKRYFNLEQVEDGYYKIIPKDIPGFVCIQTGFEDNPFLPQHIVDNYNGYGTPGHHLYNRHYFMTAIKGYASAGRKGQVHTKIKPIKLADYMALPFKETYGQDFGTAAPAALVGVKFDGNKSYCRLINYEPKGALRLGILYSELGFGKSDKIVADNADKKTIDLLDGGFSLDEVSEDTLARYPQMRQGFFMVRCVKGTDSITAGIDIMDGMELYAVEEHQELWDEIMNRVYAQNKSGEYTNDPAPGFDHAMDAWMYVIQDRRQGEYFIKKYN